MNILIYIFFVIFATVNGLASIDDNQIPGVIVQKTNIRTLTREKEKCDSGRFIDCLNCTSRIVCNLNQEIVMTVYCRGLTPYCNNGFCVTQMPSTCSQSNGVSELCPGEGYFPHPASCDRYNYCDENKRANEYRCPLFFAYDHSKGLCKRRLTFDDCPIINCLWNRNKNVVYPPDKSLYFYCGQPIVLKKCDKGAFNPQTNRCEFDCTAPGRFPHETDDTKYYLCLDIGNDKYQRFLQSCPAGMIFSGKACLVKPSTEKPILTSSVLPTNAPSDPPTNGPTNDPSDPLTNAPSNPPSDPPTNAPTNVPSDPSTNVPSNAPSDQPSNIPTNSPSDPPTDEPTNAPSDPATNGPTNDPSDPLTNAPTNAPSDPPTNEPTNAPSDPLTNSPSNLPSDPPTNAPANVPSDPSTNVPSNAPGDQPSNGPTNSPSDPPADEPTNAPNDPSN